MLTCLASAALALAATSAEFDAAVDHWDYALAARNVEGRLARTKPTDDVRNADVRATHIDAARLAIWGARWEEADQHLDRLEKRLRAALPADDPALLDLLIERTALASRLAEFAEADRYLAEALRIGMRKSASPGEMTDTLTAQVELLDAQHRWWEALQASDALLRQLEKTHGPDSFEVGRELVARAAYLKEPFPSRFDRQRDSLQRAGEILARAYERNLPSKRASREAMVDWAFSDVLTRDYAKWDECVLRKEWVDATEAELGATSLALVAPLTDYASYCDQELPLRQSTALFERALAIARGTFPGPHPEIQYVREHQGVYFASREYAPESVNEKGRAILAEVDHDQARLYPKDGSYMAMSAIYAALEIGDFSCRDFNARSCGGRLTDAIAVLARRWGADHPALAELRSHLALTVGQRSTGDDSANARASRRRFVQEQFTEALRVSTARLGARNPQTARIAGAQAEYLGAEGLHKEAAALQTQVVESYREHFGPRDAATLEAQRLLDYWSGRPYVPER